MTASRHVTIWCDGEDSQGRCWDFTGGDHPRAKEARRDAAESGWVHRDGKDLCPLHAAGRERPEPYMSAGDREFHARLDAAHAKEAQRWP